MWFVVVCGSLWWFVVVCGGLWCLVPPIKNVFSCVRRFSTDLCQFYTSEKKKIIPVLHRRYLNSYRQK